MRLGILISGRGSNLEAIANSIARPETRRRDRRRDQRTSRRARAVLDYRNSEERGIPLQVIPSAGMDRETYDKLLIDELRTHEVDPLVVLPVFMPPY